MLKHDINDKSVVGEVVPGIPFAHHEVILGDYARKPGDEAPRAIFDASNPPETENGFVLEALAEKIDERTLKLSGPLTHDRDALLLVSSDNPGLIVPPNDKDTRGSFYRHAPIRRSSGVTAPKLKGLRNRHIGLYSFEVEVGLFRVKMGESIIVKPAGAHSDESRIITFTRNGFTVVREGDRISVPDEPKGLIEAENAGEVLFVA